MDAMTRRTFLTSSGAIAALAAVPAQGQKDPAAQGLSAGVATRDITPEPGVDLWGYSDRTGPATGTLDPLFAKAVVFRAGGSTAALVALDLGRVPMQDATDRIRRRAREAGVPDEALGELRAPIGLPIGAETPEEIAVSIAAEIVAVRRGAGERADSAKVTPLDRGRGRRRTP